METNEYRGHAFECLSIADDTMTNPENRMLLLGRAQAWLKLAQRAEQNAFADVAWQPNSRPIAATAG
jgi:hypothetical protein